MQPISVAIVGLGWVGQNRHKPAFKRCKDFKLAGVIDPREGRAQALARAWHLPYAAASATLDRVPWLYQVQALALATPPATHANLALHALSLGKHVLTEKPFALDEGQAHAMAKAARASKKTLAVVHNFQFSRAAQKLFRDLAKGRLGEVTRVAATQLGNPARRLPLWYETLPLGLFYDESPHFFYMLNALASGPLELLSAKGIKSQTQNTPRSVHLFYKDQNGTPLTIDCQFDSALSEWFVRVSGTRATAFVDLFRDIYILLPNDRAHNAPMILRTSARAISQHLAAHIPNGFSFLRGTLDYGMDQVALRFARAIRTGQEDDKIGLAQARAVHKLQQQAVEALQENLIV